MVTFSSAVTVNRVMLSRFTVLFVVWHGRVAHVDASASTQILV